MNQAAAPEPFVLNLPKQKRLAFRLIVHVFPEGLDYPSVTHIFNGSTPEEVRGVYREHRKQDRLLRNARKGVLDGRPCRLELKWHQLSPHGWTPLEVEP